MDQLVHTRISNWQRSVWCCALLGVEAKVVDNANRFQPFQRELGSNTEKVSAAKANIPESDKSLAKRVVPIQAPYAQDSQVDFT